MSRLGQQTCVDTPYAEKRYGAYIGIVDKNTSAGGKDTKYKIRLRLPCFQSDNGEILMWARVMVPMGGAERGTYSLPEVGDQVLVVFEHGEIRRPIVVGTIWNEKDKPPADNADGENNLRIIKSKSGHQLVFDDSNGKERVTISDATNLSTVTLDSANNSVTLLSKAGNITLVASTGCVRLHGKDVSIATTSRCTGKGKKLHVVTDGKLNVQASGQLKLAGAMVQINPGGSASVQQAGQVESTPASDAGAAASFKQQKLQLAGGLASIPGSEELLNKLSNLADFSITGNKIIDDALKQAARDIIEGIIKGEKIDDIGKRAIASLAGPVTKGLLDEYVGIDIVTNGVSKAVDEFVEQSVLEGKDLDDAALDALKAGAKDAAETVVRQYGQQILGK